MKFESNEFIRNMIFEPMNSEQIDANDRQFELISHSNTLFMQLLFTFMKNNNMKKNSKCTFLFGRKYSTLTVSSVTYPISIQIHILIF